MRVINSKLRGPCPACELEAMGKEEGRRKASVKEGVRVVKSKLNTLRSNRAMNYHTRIVSAKA